MPSEVDHEIDLRNVARKIAGEARKTFQWLDPLAPLPKNASMVPTNYGPVSWIGIRKVEPVAGNEIAKVTRTVPSHYVLTGTLLRGAPAEAAADFRSVLLQAAVMLGAKQEEIVVTRDDPAKESKGLVTPTYRTKEPGVMSLTWPALPSDNPKEGHR